MDVLGSLAAALQVADAGFSSLLKVYAVMKGRKKVPKQLHQLVHDLENSQSLLAELRREVLQPQSRFAAAPNQSQRLITVLEATASCSQTLSARLDKALPTFNDSRLKRVWRALALLSKEEDFIRECDRLRTLKQDLQIELQNIGVALISAAK